MKTIKRNESAKICKLLIKKLHQLITFEVSGEILTNLSLAISLVNSQHGNVTPHSAFFMHIKFAHHSPNNFFVYQCLEKIKKYYHKLVIILYYYKWNI